MHLVWTVVSLGTDATLGDYNYSVLPTSTTFFKRAPGVMDIVGDASTGAVHTVAHGVGAAPELWIRKAPPMT